MNSELDNYLQRASQLVPEKARSIKLIDSGWSNIVVEINDKWICRFVRDIQSTQFQLENGFLKSFEPTSPIAVPAIVNIGSDYIVYHRLSGERFSPQKYQSFAQDNKNLIQRQLGEFLSVLHTTSFKHPQLKVFPYGGGDFWLELWQPVAKLLSPQVRTEAKYYFEKAFTEIDFQQVNKTISHADLATNNILCDYTRQSLTGIIDFSDLCLADPAADFAGFYRHFGLEFTKSVLTYYRGDLGTQLEERFEFHCKRKLFFVVYFALNYGFEESIPGIIDTIETQF